MFLAAPSSYSFGFPSTVNAEGGAAPSRILNTLTALAEPPVPAESAENRAASRTRTGGPILTMDVLYH